MRHSPEAAEFGRQFLRIVERESRGDWVRSKSVFDAAIAEHADNPYVVYLAENTKRRVKVTHIIADVMPEFPRIERRKDGNHRTAAVWYRARPTALTLTDDETISAQGFARWRAALLAAARPMSGGLKVLADHRVAFDVLPGRARADGYDVKLASQFPAPPWTLEINEPGQAGKENGVSAIGLDADGFCVLLRQGRLQANPQSPHLIVGEDFRSFSGLRPASVALPDGRLATREWFVVARLDAEPDEIVWQTVAFVDACADARRAFEAGRPIAPSDDLLFAPDESDAPYTVTAREAADATTISRRHGEVWLSLAELCVAAGVTIRKPIHRAGYETDAEILSGSAAALVEIKTTATAADIYAGVGQLTLYRKLMPALEGHKPILLLGRQPSRALREAVERCDIELHVYEQQGDSGAISFPAGFMSAVGIRAPSAGANL